MRIEILFLNISLPSAISWTKVPWRSGTASCSFTLNSGRPNKSVIKVCVYKFLEGRRKRLMKLTQLKGFEQNNSILLHLVKRAELDSS